MLLYFESLNCLMFFDVVNKDNNILKFVYTMLHKDKGEIDLARQGNNKIARQQYSTIMMVSSYCLKGL